jgi:hypothetical protein
MGRFLVERIRKPRSDYVAELLREFQRQVPTCDPLELILAEESGFPTERAAKRGYPKNVAGVYLYSDACREDEPHGIPDNDDDRFTVIRWIGKVTTNFASEKRNKQTARNPPRFSHKWLEIIPIPDHCLWWASALEHFLIHHATTTHNKHFNSRLYRRFFQEW